MSIVRVYSIVDSTKMYEYVDDGRPKQGGVKDVYFSPKREYVVAFFREKQDTNQKERIKKIVTLYHENIKKGNASGYYLNDIFRWPYDAVEKNGLIGVIVPIYKSDFFFTKGYQMHTTLVGGEKVGKWFTSPSFRNKQFPFNLDKSELGDWSSYLFISLNIVRGIKKMHQMGLAHSDLSYNNILVDPITKSANIIDLDGLVVPGMFPPEVIGTADFIAPEVLKTKHLLLTDPNRVLPNQKTDLHALAVLLYMYLLRRHPLRGGKIWDIDSDRDEIIAMGERALFIEHPDNDKNRVNINQLSKWDNFWGDPAKVPYTILGPYLIDLMNRALIDGLHNPLLRPMANEWEAALLKTIDILLECVNPHCSEKWFVFDNTSKPTCPFCGEKIQHSVPIIDIYSKNREGVWKLENHRILASDQKALYKWHISKNVINNENLTEEDKEEVAVINYDGIQWVLTNKSVLGMKDMSDQVDVLIGGKIVLQHDKKILMSAEEGGKLLYVTMV